jgi:hypothetical protein
VALRGRWRMFEMRVGYHVGRGWSPSAEMTLIPEGDQPNRPPPTSYNSDNTFLTHGPGLSLVVGLPWHLSLEASFWTLWYRYDTPEEIHDQTSQVVLWQEERRDLQLLAGAELRRPLPCGLEAGVYFGSIDNLSSIDQASPVINRSYARRMVGGVLRWRWWDGSSTP